MTIHNIISAALARRNLRPQTFVCGGCDETCDIADHASNMYEDYHLEAIENEYGKDVCLMCADTVREPEPCDYCRSFECHCDDAYDIWKDTQND